MTDAELPKHKLLVKLLKMTTSPNDGEALTAIRKANELLLAAAWDWERLLAGKIVVVGDPFTSLETPAARKDNDRHPYTPNPPSRRPAPPAHATAKQSTQPPPRAAAPTQSRAPRPPVKISTRRNLYPGPCWCCGTHVDVDKGFVFDLSLFTTKTGWKVACTSCNDKGYVSGIAAPRQRRPIDSPLADVSLNDL